MSKIYINTNQGVPDRQVGDINISGGNFVTPVVAVPAPGVEVNVDALLRAGDAVVATQTGAATDELALIGGSIGDSFLVFATDAVTITVVAGEGDVVNGGTDSQGIPLIAGSVGKLVKTSATNWTCMQLAATGVLTTPALV